MTGERAAGRSPFDLSGRVAVVTGGNRGIGLGIARSLGRAGAVVAVWGRTADESARAVSGLVEDGIDAVAFRCDVTAEDEVRAATAATVDALGRIDVGVANAGGGGHHPFLDSSVADWERVLGLNLTATFVCFREWAREMATRREGALIAVSSGAAVHASPEMHAYAAAKAGLGGLVRSAAAELAPLGIRVNTLLPGWTENSRMSSDGVPASLRIETVASIPVGRWGTPDDLGTAAVYLADPTLTFHTGAEIRVDGGYSVQAPYLAVRRAREQDMSAT